MKTDKFSLIFVRISVVITFLLTGINVDAQFIVSGSIIDEDSIGIDFVNIYTLNNDSIVDKSTITDKNGFFEFQLESGDYLVYLKYVGFQTDSLQVKVIDQNINLSPVLLRKNIEQLKDVIILANKPNITRKVDRLVFNFDHSISVQGGNAMDALKVTPGVIVRNNLISMVGKNEIQLMINGSLQNYSGQQIIDFLMSISAEDIKNIEVITTPPSNFNADGNMGIININLKSKLNDYWKSQQIISIDQATYTLGSHKGTFALKQNKFDLSSNWSLTHGKWLSITKQKVDYSDKQMTLNDRANDYSNRNNLTLNANYKFNRFNKIGVKYAGSIDNSRNKNLIINRIIPSIYQDSSSEIISNYNKNNTNIFNTSSIIFDHLFDTLGFKGVFIVNYLNVHNNSDQVIDSKTITQNIASNPFYGINNGEYSIQNFTANSDFSNTKYKLEFDFGLKYSFTKSRSDLSYSNTSISSETFSDIFTYTENNIAGYLSTQRNFGAKFSAKAGLRSEITSTEGILLMSNELNKYNYTRIFPTIFLKYEKSSSSSFSFEYSKRLKRPKYTMLNPFKIYSNPYYYVSGNSLLRPSYEHNIQLNNIYKDHLITTVYYKHSENVFSLLSNVEQGTIAQSAIMQNYITGDQIGISESFEYDYKDRISMYMSFDLAYIKNYSKSTLTRKINEGINSTLISNLSFNINQKKTLKCFIDLMYNLPSIFSMSKYYGVLNTDLTIRGVLLKKKLIVDLSIHDIFQTNTIQWMDYINGIDIYNSYRADNTYLTLEISYSFGNSKVRTQTVKTGNNDEILRSK